MKSHFPDVTSQVAAIQLGDRLDNCPPFKFARIDIFSRYIQFFPEGVSGEGYSYFAAVSSRYTLVVVQNVARCLDGKIPPSPESPSHEITSSGPVRGSFLGHEQVFFLIFLCVVYVTPLQV